MKRWFVVALILAAILWLLHAPWWLVTVPFWPFALMGIAFGLFVFWFEFLAAGGFQREIERNVKRAQGKL